MINLPRLFVHVALIGLSVSLVPTIFTHASAADIILIEPSHHYFSPTKASPSAFGKKDLQLGVANDSRIVNGTCTIKIKPYGSDPSQFTVYSPRLTNQNVPYEGGLCKTTLPANSQDVPKWDIQILLTDSSSNMVYGEETSYFMLYGPLGVTTISGQAL